MVQNFLGYLVHVTMHHMPTHTLAVQVPGTVPTVVTVHKHIMYLYTTNYMIIDTSDSQHQP